jgi:hypothetical protein
VSEVPVEIEFLTVEVVIALHQRQLDRFGGGCRETATCASEASAKSHARHQGDRLRGRRCANSALRLNRPVHILAYGRALGRTGGRRSAKQQLLREGGVSH